MKLTHFAYCWVKKGGGGGGRKQREGAEEAAAASPSSLTSPDGNKSSTAAVAATSSTAAAGVVGGEEDPTVILHETTHGLLDLVEHATAHKTEMRRSGPIAVHCRYVCCHLPSSLLVSVRSISRGAPNHYVRDNDNVMMFVTLVE